MRSITPKEQEILRLLADGMSTKQIAAHLAISFHTVESHRKNLRMKFEARNSAEMISKALRSPLI